MSIEAAIRKFNKKVQDASDVEFKARCVEIAIQAIKNTPVDTGRLRANWHLTFGFRTYEEVAWVEVASAAAAQAAAVRRVEAAVTNRDEKVAYITNNLPYAMPVEVGGPTNRPRRMLTRAIQRASR